MLIFDAKVTNFSYGEWKFENEQERQLIERFGATLRFVATMSGLTRWQFIYGEVEVDTDQEFGDFHTTAIDETWYKSAILQHRQDNTESFVYSVKHYDDPVEDSELKVTASHAIFPRDGGMEAPACVVGFQFSHARMWERFFNITAVDNVSMAKYYRQCLLTVFLVLASTSATAVWPFAQMTTSTVWSSITMRTLSSAKM